MTTTDLPTRFAAQRIALILDEPFFGAMLMELDPVFDESSKTKTMATDGQTLWINPKFAETLDDRQFRTVLAHEVMHCALCHHTRMGARNHQRWNVATDYAINNALDDYNQWSQRARSYSPFDLPSAALLDHSFDGESAEQIYNKLPEPPPQDNSGEDEGQGTAGEGGEGSAAASSIGEVLPAPVPAGDANAAAEAETKWKVAAEQAARAAKMKGSLPGGIARLVESLLAPDLPWTDLLRQFVRERARNDFSWSRPNKAAMAHGIILPSMHSETMGPVAVAIDTSGSVDEPLLRAFLSEIEAIFHECRPSEMHVIDCDAEVNSHEVFAQGEDFDFTPRGGGGTDFRPVFDKLDAEAIDPVCAIYFTDLCGTFPDEAPPYPVLWIAYGAYQDAPWGETIRAK
jgi:predicted metal-dependent peptidase